jgi:hypothetical protein
MSRADDIQREQSELQRELEAIQGECQHKHQSIRFNYKQKSHMWKCNTCNLFVRYPSKKELDKFLNS